MTQALEFIPAHDDGHLLSSDIEINRVASARPIGDPIETKYATLHKQRIVMEDGTKYDVTSSRAIQRLIDVAITETAAWTTNELGFNRHRMLNNAKLGIETDFVSPQQNLKSIGNLSNGAHNQLEIAKFTADQFNRDPETLIVHGVSRGAMHGFGVVDLAPLHDVNVLHAELTVPCFPSGVRSIREAIETLIKFPHETAVIEALSQLPHHIQMLYIQTIATSPKELFQHAKEVPTLLSGAVGQHVRHMPAYTFAHVVAFGGDAMGQGEKWQRLLTPDEYKNITVEYIEGGGHLSCASADCTRGRISRAETIRDILLYEPTARTMGATALRKLAVAINQDFDKAA